jgi:hypothetical protein
MVAKVFAELLGETNQLRMAFRKVVFAVFDRTDVQKTFQAFQQVFCEKMR